MTFLEANDIDISRIKGVDLKVDEKTGYTVYINLKSKGNNSLKLPFDDDFEKAKRVFNEIANMTKARYTRYRQGLKALEDL